MPIPSCSLANLNASSTYADSVRVPLAASRVVKSVKFNYSPTPMVLEALRTFRDMVNDAIRICLAENICGRLRLRSRIYKEFQEKYRVMSCYPYSVAEVAWSIVKKHRRWNRTPFAKRLMMKMESQKYTLNHGILSLPFKRGRKILIPLEYSDYQRSFLLDESLKRGSVTLNEHGVIIAFSKGVQPFVPVCRVGIDLNEKSAVCSDGRRYDLSEVARLHTEYGIRRSNFYGRHAGDRRLKRKFAGSRREKERVKQLLHRTAKEIVEMAKTKKQAIILERLAGIRYAHLKGNSEGKGRRRRISQWPFRILQGNVLYKAAWSGVPVEFVSPSWTSKTCSNCNNISRDLGLAEREWRCPSCGATLDRDLNAAVNIERRGKIACLGEVRPGARDKDEAVKGNEQSIAPILRVEVPKLARRERIQPS